MVFDGGIEVGFGSIGVGKYWLLLPNFYKNLLDDVFGSIHIIKVFIGE